MRLAFLILVDLAVVAAMLHWHGAKADQLRAWEAELRTKSRDLDAWTRRLALEDLRIAGKCPSKAECLRNVSRSEAYGRVLADLETAVTGLDRVDVDPPPACDAAGVDPSPAPANSPDEERPNWAGPGIYLPRQRPTT